MQLDLATESSQATSIAVVSLDEEGVASYTFHFDDTANFGWQVDDLPELADSDWLHIASLACVVSPGAEVLLDWMRGVTCGVSYDINVRPTVISDPEVYWAKVQPWLRVVGQRDGILKASDADIEFLAQAPGVRPRRGDSDPVDVAAELGRAVRARARRWSRWVPAAGRPSSRAAADDPVQSFPTKVVDTVGAGDTFMAGFLDASDQAGPGPGGRRCAGAPPRHRSSAPAGVPSRRPRPRWTS